MDYIVLIVTIILNTGLFMVSGAYGKKERFNSPLFTAFAALVFILFFACYNRFRFVYDPYTIKMALLYAGVYIVCMAANINAMKNGSVALTSMVASFSLLVPTFFGIIYWKESVSPTFFAGLILFCAALILSKMDGKKEQNEGSSSRKRAILWVILAAILFFTNGICSILTTFHQKTGGDVYRGEFMIVSMAIVFAVNFALAALQLKGELPVYLKSASLYGAGYGLLNSGIRLGVMILAANGVINQSVFFPVISVAVMVLVFICSVLFFKEKFRPVQYAGVALGVASIVLLQL